MKKNILNTIIVIFITLPFSKMVFAQVPPVKLLCVNDEAFKCTGNDITIEWALTGTPCGVNFESFDIYVSDDPNGGFQLLFSEVDESTLFYCDAMSLNNPALNSDFYYYYIENNCGANTSAPSEIVSNRRPAFPQIEYVTVNDDAVEISWLPSTSTDAAGYIIYYYIPGSGPSPLDTISPTNNIYIHQANPLKPNFMAPSPNINPERYTIATVDACNFGGTVNSRPHETMHLKAATMECSNSVSLNWNQYEGWNQGVDHYEIYGSINGGVPAVLNNNISADVSAYTYVNDFPDVNELCFQVKALRYGDLITSSSNDTCVSLADVSSNTPAYLYIKQVSVLPNGTVELSYYADSSVYVEAIKYESGNTQDNIAVFDSEFIGGNLPDVDSYIHITSETINRALYYRIEVEDTCGNTYNTGLARTIFLQGKADGSQTNYLNWGAYGNEFSEVNEYDIYRQNIIDGSFEIIGTVNNQTIQFTEDVQEVETNENGQVCYKVEARVTVAYPLLEREEITSSSNIVCINQPARITVPNAFAPEGINNVFIPFTLNVDPMFYNMVIFNRWGGVVFESSNPDEGWDGTYQGRVAQEGVYMYNFTYAGSDGNQKQKKGSVVLLR